MGVATKTALEQIVQNSNGTWDIWIAINDKSLPGADWRGTFVRLYPDGSAQRITLDPDGNEDVMDVMEKGNIDGKSDR